jgi:hypothetical protein
MSRYRSFNVKTSKSPHAILDRNEGNSHLAVREMEKIPGISVGFKKCHETINIDRLVSTLRRPRGIFFLNSEISYQNSIL